MCLIFINYETVVRRDRAFSGDLNTGLLHYSNGQNQSGCLMFSIQTFFLCFSHVTKNVLYLSIWLDSKPIVWDSSVVFTDNSDWLALSLTRSIYARTHIHFHISVLLILCSVWSSIVIYLMKILLNKRSNLKFRTSWRSSL